MIFGKRPKASSCTKLVPRWYMSHFKWSGTKLALLCTTMHRLRVPRWYPGGTQVVPRRFMDHFKQSGTKLVLPCTNHVRATCTQVVRRRYPGGTTCHRRIKWYSQCTTQYGGGAEVVPYSFVPRMHHLAVPLIFGRVTHSLTHTTSPE